IKSGGRGRLSTLVAGVVLLLMVVFLNDWVSKIPMAALVAVMIMVSIGTFSWQSLADIRVHPLSTSVVMIATVIVVVWTHNLAYGVLVGVLIAALNFANKVARYMTVTSTLDKKVRHYGVRGQIFFATSERFVNAFDFKEDIDKAIIDVNQAHFWDITSVSALDKVVIKFRREGIDVEIKGMNEATATLVDKFGIHDDPKKIEKFMGGH
ncbi:STAS domain-containing protein, partial [Providencia sp. PROV169]